jgi:hypothetical protein
MANCEVSFDIFANLFHPSFVLTSLKSCHVPLCVVIDRRFPFIPEVNGLNAFLHQPNKHFFPSIPFSSGETSRDEIQSRRGNVEMLQ